MARDSFLKTAIPLVAVTAIGVYNLPPMTEAERAEAEAEAEQALAVERSVYYPGCDAVRTAGKAPLYRGDPGYREGMDGDNDGIACEPYRGY